MKTRTAILLVSFGRLLKDAFRLLLTNAGFDIIDDLSIADVEALTKLTWEIPAPPLVLINFEHSRESLDAWARLRLLEAGKFIALSHETDLSWINSDQLKSLDGIITHDVSFERFVQSLRLIEAGERIFPSALLQAVAKRTELSETETEVHTLSPREGDIIRHLTRGSSNKSIALSLGIADTTVKVHIKAALRKIGVANRTQAALWAQRTDFDQRIARGKQIVQWAEERVAHHEALLLSMEDENDPTAVKAREQLLACRRDLELARAQLRRQHCVLRICP